MQPQSRGVMPPEYMKEVNELRKNVKDFVDAELKKLDALQRLVYDFIFVNVFVDDTMKAMMIQLRNEMKEKKEGEPQPSLYNYVSGWGRGLIDSVKGNRKIDDDAEIGHFVRSVIDLVPYETLVPIHINILCEYVWTQNQMKMLEEKYRGNADKK